VAKLKREFYQRDTITVARELLGKILVRVIDNIEYKCRIIETEAYTGVEDKACHTYGGRKTLRTKTMWGEAGHVYVYMIYGMYYLLNIVTEAEGSPCAVLIRKTEPIEPLEDMSILRYKKPYTMLTKSQIRGMGDGPGKVCRLLDIKKSEDGTDLLGEEIYILDSPAIAQEKILADKRINIDYAEEAKDYLYRFYILK